MCIRDSTNTTTTTTTTTTSKSKSKAKIQTLGGTGPSGRPLAIAIRCATKHRTFDTNSEPKRSNGSLKSVQTKA
eukprot:16240455-Heterocapsa_arctica.AAC.1